MRKLLLILLIIPYVINSQVLKCNIEVTNNYELSNDTTVNVIIKNVTQNYIYSMHYTPLVLCMQPDNEYLVTLTKDKCMAKSLFIDTHSKNNTLICERVLFLSIDMTEGDMTNTVDVGKIWYDEITDRFVYKVPSSTKVRQH